MKLLIEESTTPFDTIRKWAPRLIAATLFLFVGYSKFADHSQWVGIFEKIGFGQWFRYFTGMLQVGGALLILIPRTFPAGILILACTMAGAMGAWIFFLGMPLNALIPGMLPLGLIFVGGEGLLDFFSSIRL